jgi:putative membrane protein
MGLPANVLVGFTAAPHVAFLVLEMFLWRGPWGGRKILGMTQDQADASAPLARNQGLYNGFLAAGMVYMLSGQEGSHAIGVFCLGCAVTAGLFGAATVKPLFLLVQALPAAAALACIWLASGSA